MVVSKISTYILFVLLMRKKAQTHQCLCILLKVEAAMGFSSPSEQKVSLQQVL